MAFGNATKGYVKAHSGGGGSSGTTDYTDLSNKPSINGVTLSGNKTSSDLGITSGGVSVELASGSFNKDDVKLIILVGTDGYSQITGNAYPINEVTNGATLIAGYDEQRCGYAQFAVAEDGTVTWTFGGNVPPSKIYLIS